MISECTCGTQAHCFLFVLIKVMCMCCVSFHLKWIRCLIQVCLLSSYCWYIFCEVICMSRKMTNLNSHFGSKLPLHINQVHFYFQLHWKKKGRRIFCSHLFKIQIMLKSTVGFSPQLALKKKKKEIIFYVHFFNNQIKYKFPINTCLWDSYVKLIVF